MTLPICPSRTALKLHVISVTRKIVKKVITNLDSSKVPGLDCIPVVVLKNYEQISYRLAELFIMSEGVLFSRLLEGLICGPCVLECWERSTAKNYVPVSLFSVVSKVFQNLANDKDFDNLEK